MPSPSPGAPALSQPDSSDAPDRAVSAAAERDVARGFAALGAGEALSRIFTFLGHAWIARTLGVGVYGVVALAGATYLYLQRVADGGLTQGLGLREVAADPGNRDRLAPSLIVARTGLSTLIAAVVVAVSLLWLPEPDGAVLAVMALVLIPYGANPLWLALGLRQARSVAVARTAGEAVILVVLLLFVHDPGDVARVPLAGLLGEFTIGLILALALARSGAPIRLAFHWQRVKPLLGRAVPLMLSGLMALIVYNSDFFFLRWFRDSSAVGLYGVAYMLVSFLLNLGTAFNQSLLPTLTALGPDSEGERGLYATSMAQVFAVTLPAAVGGMLVAAGIIEIAFGERYAPAAEALYWLLPSVPLVLLRGVPSMALIARGREDRVLRINLLATGVNLALNLTLIPPFGILGAALSTVGTEVARLGAALLHARREGFGLSFVPRLVKPAIAVAAMALVLRLLPPLSVFLAVPLGAVCYGVVLTLLGGIRWRRRGPPALTV